MGATAVGILSRAADDQDTDETRLRGYIAWSGVGYIGGRLADRPVCCSKA